MSVNLGNLCKGLLIFMLLAPCTIFAQFVEIPTEPYHAIDLIHESGDSRYMLYSAVNQTKSTAKLAKYDSNYQLIYAKELVNTFQSLTIKGVFHYDSTGGVLLYGFVGSAPDHYAYLAALDSQGNQEWAYLYKDKSEATGVALDEFGSIYFTVKTTNLPWEIGMISKITWDGKFKWHNYYRIDTDLSFEGIKYAGNGKFLCYGVAKQLGRSHFRAALCQIDTLGRIDDTRIFYVDGGDTRVKDLLIGRYHNYLICQSKASLGRDGTCVLKLNKNHSLDDSKTYYSGSGFAIPKLADINSKDEILIALNNNNLGSKGYVLGLDSALNANYVYEYQSQNYWADFRGAFYKDTSIVAYGRNIVNATLSIPMIYTLVDTSNIDSCFGKTRLNMVAVPTTTPFQLGRVTANTSAVYNSISVSIRPLSVSLDSTFCSKPSTVNIEKEISSGCLKINFLPASKELFILSEGDQVEIEIIDQLGKKVFGTSAANQSTIGLSSLSQGLYFVRAINSKNTCVQTRKIVL